MKRAISLLLAVLLALALAACGAKEPTNTKGADVDVTKLAAELVEKVKFTSAEMKDMSDKLSFFVDLPEGTQAAFYRGDSATKEQIIAAKCAGEKDAEALKADLQKLLDGELEEARRYTPELVPLLEKAVLIQKGACVVFCVTDDADTAEKIIKGYLG